jgi:uncharacterized Tic20 family protein
MKLTSEEKLWATLSHLSAFMSGTGLIVPAFVWVENRKKSKRIAFQALQAFGYQSLGYTLWTLVALILILALSLVTLPELQQKDGASLFIRSHLVLTILLYAIYLLIPVIGAVKCVLGQDFRYPLLGDRLARMVGYDPSADNDAPLDSANEERFAAAMGHFAIVYSLWGMLPSLIFLLVPKVQSRYMKFQSLQTIAFQLVSLLISIVLGIITLALFITSAATTLLPYIQNPRIYQPTPEMFLPFFLFLLCLMMVALIVPLFQIVGQWAGLRLLQGREYRYEIIGRQVERWLAKREE